MIVSQASDLSNQTIIRKSIQHTGYTVHGITRYCILEITSKFRKLCGAHCRNRGKIKMHGKAEYERDVQSIKGLLAKVSLWGPLDDCSCRTVIWQQDKRKFQVRACKPPWHAGLRQILSGPTLIWLCRRLIAWLLQPSTYSSIGNCCCWHEQHISCKTFVSLMFCWTMATVELTFARFCYWMSFCDRAWFVCCTVVITLCSLDGAKGSRRGQSTELCNPWQW